MSFYIVNVVTGKRHGTYSWLAKAYETERGAKTACTKLNKVEAGAWKVMSANEFNAIPVKMVERINMMTGKPYMEAEDTPNFCSPASESYWSM